MKETEGGGGNLQKSCQFLHSIPQKLTIGPMGKAAKKWFRWNMDTARGNIHPDFLSPFYSPFLLRQTVLRLFL